MDRIYVITELARDQKTGLLISSLIRYVIKGYQLSAAMTHVKL